MLKVDVHHLQDKMRAPWEAGNVGVIARTIGAPEVKAFSETDFHEDLKKFDVPTLIMHGEDDQIVPINISGKRSAKLIKGAKGLFFLGLPHGLTATYPDQVNAHLLKFVKSLAQARKSAA